MVDNATSGQEENRGHWYSAPVDRASVGAYMLQAGGAYPDLTIYWHGQITLPLLTRILYCAEPLFRERETHRSLVAYGSTKETLVSGKEDHTTNMSDRLDSMGEDSRFQAFRAELESYDHKFILWANVDEKIPESKENIGICVNTNFFSHAQNIITDAIERSTGLENRDAERAVNNLWKKALRSY